MALVQNRIQSRSACLNFQFLPTEAQIYKEKIHCGVFVQSMKCGGTETAIARTAM
jgi:hypothetical protein